MEPNVQTPLMFDFVSLSAIKIGISKLVKLYFWFFQTTQLAIKELDFQ
jgi:hypothetical protein